MTLGDEAVGERPAQKAGAARDDDLHVNRNQYTE